MINYSILYYSSSILTDRGIPLAILFYNIDTKETKLMEIDNWLEISMHDNDINIDLIKVQLDGIREEIKDISKDINFSLEKYTKFFINELRFSTINSIEARDYNKCIERYYKKKQLFNSNEELVKIY